MRILLAGATGVIGRQAVPVLAAAGHQVVGLARTPARLPDAEVLAADALDRAAVQGAVLAAGPDVIVHMLTAIPDPVDPRHLARDMALTNRLHTQGTANLLAAAGGLTRRLRAGRLPLIGDGPRCSPSSTPTTWPRRSWPPSSTRRPGGP
jgi:nucleoside-diphosphate-sugar epimerase